MLLVSYKSSVMGELNKMAVVAFLTSASHVLAVENSLTWLGDSASDFEATAVSADGLVVIGYAANVPDNSGGEAGLTRMEGFRWTQSGGFLDLGNFRTSPGKEETLPLATSSDGSVIVGLAIISDSFPWAFRWTQGGGLTNMGICDNAHMALSADGTVFVATGFATITEGDVSREIERPFRETSQGRTYLDPFPETLSSDRGVAEGVSADGSVIAGTWNGTTTFRWTAGGGMTNLGKLDGDVFSECAGISGDGKVVFGVSFGTRSRAFRWTAEAGMSALNLSSWFNSAASSASLDGRVIVGSADGFPFIWDVTNGSRMLKEVLAEDYGLDVGGWRPNDQFLRISSDGRTIIGNGDTKGPWIARIGDVTIPRLKVTRQSGKILIRWPVGARDWRLESVPSIDADLNGWTAIPGPYAVSGESFVATDSEGASGTFYRLRQGPF